MKKCVIIDEKKFEGRIYYKVVTNSGSEYILRKVQDDDYQIVNYNKYSKVFNNELKNNKIKIYQK